MEYFVKVIFIVLLGTVLLSILNIATGAYAKPVSLGVKAADTVLTAILCLWAGFALWY